MPQIAGEPDLVIPHALVQQMLAHVQACLPEEACGILGGRREKAILALAVENELHSPVRFRMRAEDQLRAFLAVEEAGLEFVAIWHSHPSGPAHLSPTDLAEAYYPEAFLLVWSPQEGQMQDWQLLAFHVVNGQAVQVSLRVV
jgi:proteasome lid subunit RPN8/RPN11